MKIYNKYEERKLDRTPILIPIITVDILEDTGIIINNESLKKYHKTIAFNSCEEFNEFKKNNNL